MDEGNPRRRRGLGVVTPNACTECRKRRAKASCGDMPASLLLMCDGQVPCGRCSSIIGVECAYEIPMRQSKQNMRSEIESLKTQQRQNERILKALASDDDSANTIINQLRSGDHVEHIVDQLDRRAPTSSVGDENRRTTFTMPSHREAISNALQPAMDIQGSFAYVSGVRDTVNLESQNPGQSTGRLEETRGSISQDSMVSQYDDPMVWDPENIPVTQHSLPLIGTWHPSAGDVSSPGSSTLHARAHGQSTILGHPKDFTSSPQKHAEAGGTWTTVTSDLDFVEHLMTLYFCWEYPTFASLNKEHFLEGFKAGSTQHCSPLLVNSILALGCRFSNQPNARTDPENSNTAGDHFFTEAVRLLDLEENRHVLTTIQALGLLSIREASCSRSSDGLFFAGQSIRLAIEMGLHLENYGGNEMQQADYAVRSATFWGAFSLDQAWSLSIGRLPQFSKDLQLVTKPEIIDHIESSHWVPYTDDGAPLERSCIQPSNVRSVYKTFCELSEIVHATLYTLYSPGSTLTSKSLLVHYTKYLNWYASIPETLRLGQNFTPAVLFAHMYYHYAMILLFRPFIRLKITGSGVSPKDVCRQAANAISTLVNSYSKLYTLRRTPSFVPYYVLCASITHAVSFGVSKAAITVSEDSQQKKDSKMALQQGVDCLKEMTGCHGFATRAVDILRYLTGHWGLEFSVDEKSENTLDYKLAGRSSTSSMNQFCPNIGSLDMKNPLGPVGENENPLFWTFPLQGRPLLDVGPRLVSLGFTILP
ncbi:fungal-specific transcription factor domain-containing protein [Amylocarpus encephaloides]|uniref:Fungal-specific transcription factor domain-containing protein n=1 Tax=Amylocarpus encephaloides TaxID=45428 RepID=A0A9P7YEE2_9HELO|nr:fungal-specific transcription factor domain-containing protein [Amylocarpus encephaloides]